MAWIWLVVALLAFGIEMSRGDFYVFWFGIGALVAYLFGGTPWLAALVFLALSALLLWLLRPSVIRRLAPPRRRDPPEELIGQTGLVLREVHPQSDFVGLVELDGRRYAARSFGSDRIPPGTVVEVLGLDGIQVVVHPVGQSLIGGDAKPPVTPPASREEPSS
jgi:membrane protein implicated in regulation of membrane protease activity